MVIIIHIPIFKQNIRCLIEPTKQELKRYKIEPEAIGRSLATTYDTGVILFYNAHNITPGLVAHEMVHAINYFFKFVGLKNSEDTEELVCYLLDHCIEQFFKKLRRKNEIFGIVVDKKSKKLKK